MPEPEVAPGTGAGASNGGGAPSPSAEPSRPTDRDMLNSALSSAGEPAAPSGEPAAAAGAAPGAASPEATAEEQAREKMVPDELRELFKQNPKLKEFRDAKFSDSAYRELFPQISDARELRQLFPTLDDAKRAVESAEQHAQLEELFTSDPDGYLKAISEGNPEAFQAVAERMDGFMRQLNPQAWQAKQETSMRDLLGQAHSYAVETQNEDLQAAVDLIHQAMWGRPFAPVAGRQPSAKERELGERERKLSEREEAERQKVFTNYQQSVQSQYIEGTVAEIEKQVKALLPDVSESAQKRIVKEIFSEIDGRLAAMPAVKAELQRRGAGVRKSGADERAITEAVEYLTKRSLGMVAQVAADKVSEWTKDILATNKSALQKQQDAASRKDVGAGGGGAVPPKPPIIPPGKKLTDREMLEAALSAPR